MGFTSTLKSTTTASPEEGSGNTTDSEDDNYWNVVYEAIVWIDAFTVRGIHVDVKILRGRGVVRC